MEARLTQRLNNTYHSTTLRSLAQLALLAGLGTLALAGCGGGSSDGDSGDTCANGVMDGEETDIDCGGSVCGPCEVGKSCTGDDDCATKICDQNECVSQVHTSCTDKKRNGQETDTDCGGGICLACDLGKTCKVNTDCTSGFCHNGTCAKPFAVRANGGVSKETSFDNKTFTPLLGFLTDGQAKDSTEGLDKNFAVAGTPFPKLYQTETWLPKDGPSATFSFKVDNGTYDVHLHFVDWATATTKVGDRVFGVQLEDKQVLSHFDIISEVGKNRALVKTFHVNVQDGDVTLTISPEHGYPEIAAVEIVSPGQPYVGEQVANGPPLAPSELKANGMTATGAPLSWKDNAANETHYEVQWRKNTEADFSQTITLPADTTNYLVKGLVPSTAYVFRVGAMNNAGVSYSQPLTASTEAVAAVHCNEEAIRCVDGQEYKTIQEAVDAAASGDKIYVQAGSYPEQVTIAKDHLSLSAMPGDEGKAVITGAKAVSGWTLASSSELNGNPNAAHIYVAPAPCKVQRLFQGKTELAASRYPRASETGEDRYVHVSSGDSSHKKSVFTVSSLGKPTGYFVGSRAHVRTAQWRIGARRVSGSSSAGQITLAADISGYDINPQWGVYFTQVVGEIAANGQWAWRNDKLYMMSAGVPSGVEAACRPFGVFVDASVQDVTINGMAVRRTSADGIHITAQTHQGVTISKAVVTECGKDGIDVEHGGGPVKVLDSDISNCWNGGIAFRQTNKPEAQRNNVHEIGAHAYDDDVLTDGRYGQCTGILLVDGPDAVIKENRITNIAYNGIAIINFGHPANRTISFNYVRDAMLGLNDGAGIYVGVFDGNPPQWDTVANNIVEHCVGSFIGTRQSTGYYAQGVGIYLDDGTSYVKVERNTTSHNPNNIFLHDAAHNQLTDNILFGATRRTLLLTHARDYCTQSKPNPREIVLTGNTMFSTNSSVTAMALSRNWATCPILKTSDNNLFQGAGSSKYISNTILKPNNKKTGYDIAGWTAATGFDKNSKQLPSCTNPHLVSNPTMQTASCKNLDGCHDRQGNAINGSVSLAAFRSQIFCGCSATPACTP